jgi:hypothetical protein
MSAFRRSVVADTKKSGGSRKGAYFERYKIPVNVPTSLILARGQYVDPNPPAELIEMDQFGRPKPVINPYFKVRMHKRATKRNGRDWFPSEPCSAGMDPHNPQPCTSCFAMESGDKSVSLGDVFVFGMAHLVYYHGHPYIGDDGNFVAKRDGSGLVIIYDECEGRTCNFCRVLQNQPPYPPQQGEAPFPRYDPRDLTTIFGKKRYIEVGKNHLSDIQGFDQIVMSQCATCKQQLITDGFACPNCNNLIIDMGNDPRNDEQISQEVLRPYPCMTCQRPVLLREVVGCDFCENQGKKGIQISIFDVVLQAMRQGESTNSHIVRQNHMTIEEFGAGINPAFFPNKTFRQHVEELLKEQYNFDEIYKPRTLQEQSKRMDLPMPAGFGAPATGPAPYMNYGPPPQQSFAAPQPGPQAAPFAPYPSAPAPGPGPQPFVPPNKPNYGR